MDIYSDILGDLNSLFIAVTEYRQHAYPGDDFEQERKSFFPIIFFGVYSENVGMYCLKFSENECSLYWSPKGLDTTILEPCEPMALKERYDDLGEVCAWFHSFRLIRYLRS